MASKREREESGIPSRRGGTEQKRHRFLTATVGIYLDRHLLYSSVIGGVTIRWTGPLDWNTGLDYWTHLTLS
jgi:hypothetical protein